MQVLTLEVGRNPDELIRQVRAFQHVRATGMFAWLAAGK
jgi:alkyl hydroperoxide reductase subunit AhpC